MNCRFCELIFRNMQYILSMDIIGNRCCKFSCICLQVTKRETCSDLCKFFVRSKVLHHRWKKVLSIEQLRYRYVSRKLNNIIWYVKDFDKDLSLFRPIIWFRLNITDTFHQTDKALDTLKEWRDIEGHKIFASKLRFQIRLDDFR